jgi:hypothetical protein
VAAGEQRARYSIVLAIRKKSLVEKTNVLDQAAFQKQCGALQHDRMICCG